MKIVAVSIAMLSMVLPMASCEREERREAKGFHIPKGDIVVGENLFKEFQCYACHSIDGIEVPEDDPNILEDKLKLGGETYKLRSYGELVTAIMDPGHSIADRYLASLPEDAKKGKIESPMIVYNEDMTVQELIDLAAFLHSIYIKKSVNYTYPYPYYY